jgi:hypothetical protein
MYTSRNHLGGPYCAYRYLPEDTAYAVIFRAMVFTNYWNLIKTIRAVFERIASLFSGPIWRTHIFGAHEDRQAAFRNTLFWSVYRRATGWATEVRFSGGHEMFLSPHLPDRPWGPPNLLPSFPIGTGGSFPGGKATGAWSWSLISI